MIIFVKSDYVDDLQPLALSANLMITIPVIKI